MKKLSDLTGNPWDDLSVSEQREIIMIANADTYRRWADIPEFSDHAMAVARFCGNKVRLWDAGKDPRQIAREKAAAHEIVRMLTE